MDAQSISRINVYVGTNTSDPADGIYLFTLDPSTGALEPAGVMDAGGNPFFLAVDSTRRFVYATNAVDEVLGEKGGGVSAFSVDAATGNLSQLNQQSAHGSTPCYVSVTRDRTCVLVANYGSGSLAALPVQPGGELLPASCTIQHEGSSVDPKRQEGPHVHSIVLGPDDRYAYAADLGTDEVRIYALDAAAGQLTPNPAQPRVPVAAGSGPRHIAFHPDGKWAYLINELSNTLIVFSHDAATGTLAETQTVATLPGDFAGVSYCADLQFHPSGRFLYGTNRGHDSIAAFLIDDTTGRLELVELVSTEGNFPWNLGVDPTGQYLLVANQGEGNVVVFSMDPETGRLRFTGSKADVPKAVCVEMIAF